MKNILSLRDFRTGGGCASNRQQLESTWIVVDIKVTSV